MPASVSEYLQSELGNALAKQPDDAARLVFLAKQYGEWEMKRRQFYLRGEQPFCGPHPELGPMTATDFILVLSAIEHARSQIERARVAA